MNSLDYIRKRLQEPEINFNESEFTNAFEISSKKIFDKIEGKDMFSLDGTDIHGNPLNITIQINFDENADFDYFITSECSHDGTLVFEYETMLRCFEKIYKLQTTYGAAPEPCGTCVITYTLGNFVISQLYDKTKYATPEQPWLQSHTIALLPVKYRITFLER